MTIHPNRYDRFALGLILVRAITPSLDSKLDVPHMHFDHLGEIYIMMKYNLHFEYFGDRSAQPALLKCP
jgi:hypothetical protein